MHGGSWNDLTLKGAVTSIVMGAISGLATAGVGSAFEGMKGLGIELLKAWTHGLVQGGLGAIQGGDFGSAFLAGAFGSLAGSATQGLRDPLLQLGAGALSGGVGAMIAGGNFWEGAATGAIVVGLNHLMHKQQGITQDQEKEGIKFFDRLKAHYESKTQETFNLTKEEFLYLVSKGKIDYKNAKLINAENNIYQASINFYDSGFDLANSFGRSTITYREVNGKTLFRSFYDRYDFDPKSWGTRSLWNEIKTRAYNVYSSGKAFDIIYNQNYLR